ncbi:MAG TPA: hypothetical protein VN512_12555 [Clostridia bacterium]|nr:hypothetical protein [Clostridia bacterium]
MKNRRIGMIAACVFVLLVPILGLYSTGSIGVSKSRIQQDARMEQQIKENWQVCQSTTDSMSALLYYSEDKRDYTASIYINKSGFSFGYFFRIGGSILEHGADITAFELEGYAERTYLSMNTNQICRIEIDDGSKTENIDLDSTKPFVVVLPRGKGSVTFYDIYGNEVIPAIRSM